MRYLTRQRLRRGTSLAVERFLYRAIPRTLRRSHFLATGVDWQRLNGRRGSGVDLVAFCLEGKRNRGHFLIDPDDLLWLVESDPFGTHAATIQRADAACSHRVEISHLGQVELGETLDWTRDPVTGTRFPKTIFSARPPADVDERFRAELHYHRHFSALAIAARISGNDRYRRALVTQWTSWLDLYPPVNDTFLNDGLETTLRLLSWTHCLSLLGVGAIEDRFCLDVLARIEAYGHLLERNYKESPLGNNHQVAEALGQLFLGLEYPEFRCATRWLDLGLQRVQRELAVQLLPGGAHVEQSAAYLVFVLECAQMALLLSRRHGVTIDEAFLTRVERATEFLMHLLKPDGTLPAFGDDCGLRLFSPLGTTGLRPKTALAVGAYLFQRADIAAAAGAPDEDIFWLLGRRGISWLRSACHSAPPRDRIHVLSEAGHITARSGWTPTSHYLHFDFGPQGLGEHPGHGHDDVLSFEFHGLGQNFIVDGGTYTYMKAHPLRRYFTGAAAHNTLLVDASRWTRTSDGPLKWPLRAGQLVAAAAGESVAYFGARHCGYADGPEPVAVERSFLMVTGQYLLILDRLTGTGPHDITSLFHLAPDLELQSLSDGALCIGPTAQLRIAGVAAEDRVWSRHTGHDRDYPSWHSCRYGSCVPAWTLRSTTRATMPFWQLTGLFPGPSTGAPLVQLQHVPNPASSSTGADVLVTIAGCSEGTTDMVLFPAPELVDATGSPPSPVVFIRTGATGIDAYRCRYGSDPAVGTIQYAHFDSSVAPVGDAWATCSLVAASLR